MTYRLISEEELEKLDLEVDNYEEPVWYFPLDKAQQIYTDSIPKDPSKDEMEEFIDYLRAFLKVTPEELIVLDETLNKIIKKIIKLYESKLLE